MLKSLSIKNLILIDSCSIELKPGLNILTGETGTGKTAFVQAISLVLGQRADSSVIRQGQNKALIEACFDINYLPSIQALLAEKGIEQEDNDSLIIRRELTRDGRSRAFINDQMATLPLLQEIGAHLVDLISQHSYHALKSSTFPRDLIDLYGNLTSLQKKYYFKHLEEIQLTDKLQQLIKQESERERELDIYKLHLKELEDAPKTPHEEEELFQEYQRLIHHKEVADTLTSLDTTISEPDSGLLPRFKRASKTLSSLCVKEPKLREASELLEQSIVALQEAAHQMGSTLGDIEFEPHHFLTIEKRLSKIERLKKKYGRSGEDMLHYKQEVQQKISKLENLEEEIDTLTSSLKLLGQETNDLAEELSFKRKKTAADLIEVLTSTLHALNMPSATLQFKIEPCLKNAHGKDSISLWIQTNQGESLSLVKEASSGGELSRLLLAIKLALFNKNLAHTIIFDEIDANVGGETAALIAEKLALLGSSRQVICITHFPQVACRADHHFRAKKEEINGRTLTLIETLDKEGREEELIRMIGGKKEVFTKN